MKEPKFKVGDFIKCTCGAIDCPRGEISEISFPQQRYYVKSSRGLEDIRFDNAREYTKLERALL